MAKLILWSIGFFILFGTLAGAIVGGGDITLREKKAGDVVFSHENHVSGASLKCTDCHSVPYVTQQKHKRVTMAEMQKGASCGLCHNGKKAFSSDSNCNKCHKK